MKDWRPSRHVEQNFASELERLMRQLFSQISPGEDVTNLGERVRLLSQSDWLDRFAWQASQRMVTGLRHEGSRTWQHAAAQSMQGSKIYTALRHELAGPVGRVERRLIAQNAELIHGLPKKIALEVTNRARKNFEAGGRHEALEKMLPYVSRWHARLVARTETSKASTALTQARSQNLGLAWYVWQTSKDARVRAAHRFMQGVLVAWSDPASPEQLLGMKNAPSPYQAGDIYNCRCYPEPLVSLMQISWPHKIFYGGDIRMITLAAFRKISNIQPVAYAA